MRMMYLIKYSLLERPDKIYYAPGQFHWDDKITAQERVYDVFKAIAEGHLKDHGVRPLPTDINILLMVNLN